jgi:hypothetical protein
VQTDYKETLIQLNHTEDYAEVWTEDRRWKTLLKKRHFKEIRAQGRGSWYRGAIDQVSIRNPKRALTISEKEALSTKGARQGNLAGAAALAKYRAAKKSTGGEA